MNASEAFSKATLYTDNVIYVLLGLPAPAITAAAAVLAEISTPFSALMADKDEVTLVLPRAEWEEFADRLLDVRVGPDYRLITFDIPMDLEIVGFMALISQALAQANIPIMAFSSFERDHLLIQADRFQSAWDALKSAQRQ